MGNTFRSPSPSSFIGFYIPVIGLREHSVLIKTLWYMRDIRPSSLSDHPDGDAMYIYITSLDREIVPSSLIRSNKSLSISQIISNSKWYTNEDHLSNLKSTAENAANLTNPLSQGPVLNTPNTAVYECGYFVPDIRCNIIKPGTYISPPTSELSPSLSPPHFKPHLSSTPTLYNDDFMLHSSDDSLNQKCEMVEVCAVFRYPNTISRQYPPLDKHCAGFYQCVVDLVQLTPSTCTLFPPATPQFNSPRLFYYSLYHQLASNTSTIPFYIITLDVCNPISLFYFLYVFNTLVYGFNNNCLYFDPDAPILIVFFNTMLIDQALVHEQEIQSLFEHFPWNVQYYNYANSFSSTSNYQKSYPAIGFHQPMLNSAARHAVQLTGSTPASLPTAPSTAPTSPPTAPPTSPPTATAGNITTSLPSVQYSYNPPDPAHFTDQYPDTEHEIENKKHFASALDRLFLSTFQHNYSALPHHEIDRLSLSHDVRYHRRFISASNDLLYRYRKYLSPPINSPIKFPLRIPFRVYPNDSANSPEAKLPQSMFHWCIFDHDHQHSSIHDTTRSQLFHKNCFNLPFFCKQTQSDSSVHASFSQDKDTLGDSDDVVDANLSCNNIAETNLLFHGSISCNSIDDNDLLQSPPTTSPPTTSLPTPSQPSPSPPSTQSMPTTVSSIHSKSILSSFTHPLHHHTCVPLSVMVGILDFPDTPIDGTTDHNESCLDQAGNEYEWSRFIKNSPEFFIHYLTMPFQYSPTTDISSPDPVAFSSLPVIDSFSHSSLSFPYQSASDSGSSQLHHVTIQTKLTNPSNQSSVCGPQSKPTTLIFAKAPWFDHIIITPQPHHVTQLFNVSPTSSTLSQSTDSVYYTSTLCPEQIYVSKFLDENTLQLVHEDHQNKTEFEKQTTSPSLLTTFFSQSQLNLQSLLDQSTPTLQIDQSTPTSQIDTIDHHSTSKIPISISPLSYQPYHFQIRFQSLSSQLHYMTKVPYDNLFVINVVRKSHIKKLLDWRRVVIELLHKFYTHPCHVVSNNNNTNTISASVLTPLKSTSMQPSLNNLVNISESSPISSTKLVYSIDQLVTLFQTTDRTFLEQFDHLMKTVLPNNMVKRDLMVVSALIHFFDEIGFQSCPHLLLIIDDCAAPIAIAPSDIACTSITTNLSASTFAPIVSPSGQISNQNPYNNDDIDLVHDFLASFTPCYASKALEEYSLHFSFVSNSGESERIVNQMTQIAIAQRMSRYERFQ